MVTLAQAVQPAGFADPISTGLSIAGIAVFLMLLYAAYKDREFVKVFTGMPMAVITLALIFIALGGAVVDISMMFGAASSIVTFALKAVSTIFLLPFFIAGILVISTVHILNVLNRAYESLK